MTRSSRFTPSTPAVPEDLWAAHLSDAQDWIAGARARSPWLRWPETIRRGMSARKTGVAEAVPRSSRSSWIEASYSALRAVAGAWAMISPRWLPTAMGSDR